MKRRKNLWIFVFAGIVVTVLMVLLLTGSVRRTIRLTPAEIQSRIEQKFPLEKRELIFTARFTDPTVAINPNTNRVILGVSASISALGLNAFTGEATAEGLVRYQASSGELYLDSPKVKVTKLEFTGLPAKYHEKANELIEKSLQEYISRTPIYRLDERDTKMLFARRVLKSISIDGNELVIELGL